VIYMPAAVVQNPGIYAIPIAPELLRQRDDILGQTLFVRQTAGHLALSGPVLTHCAAGPKFRNSEGLPHMVDALLQDQRKWGEYPA